jgi:hypothetical protein
VLLLRWGLFGRNEPKEVSRDVARGSSPKIQAVDLREKRAEPVVTAQRDGSAHFCFRESLIAWLTCNVRQYMSGSRKYALVLALIGSVVVLPAIVARICGAQIGVLAFIGVLQFLVSGLFLLTSPVSLCFALWTLVKKEWAKAGVYSISVGVPWLTWLLLFLTNRDGVEAAMSV